MIIFKLLNSVSQAGRFGARDTYDKGYSLVRLFMSRPASHYEFT